MKNQTRRTKLVLLWINFVLLMAPAPGVVGAPRPLEMAINDDTKKCAEFFPGDECFNCIPTDGWTSVGVIQDGATCPEGYGMTDTNQVLLNCTHLKAERCCGDVFSGAGNCEDLVINDVKKQCAFVEGGIASCVDDLGALPPGWKMQRDYPNRKWLCPEKQGYVWVDKVRCLPCRKIIVDFDKAADGTPIKRGDYVTDQWKSLGLMLAASGTVSSKKGARIFDTANPGSRKAGDPDLGAPNKRCTPAGPGIGKGGEPGEPDKKGVNCKAHGNVLIVQEDNDRPDVPNDNRNGGTLTMIFSAKRRHVYKMGLLDIHNVTTVDIVYVNGKGVTAKKTRKVPELGENSFQVFKINQANVTRVTLTMVGSGAVTFVSFCA